MMAFEMTNNKATAKTGMIDLVYAFKRDRWKREVDKMEG